MISQPNTQSVRERLTKLFEFLKAYTDLRYPPVRDIAQQPRLLWLHDLPSHPSVELFRDKGKSDDGDAESDFDHGEAGEPGSSKLDTSSLTSCKTRSHCRIFRSTSARPVTASISI